MSDSRPERVVRDRSDLHPRAGPDPGDRVARAALRRAPRAGGQGPAAELVPGPVAGRRHPHRRHAGLRDDAAPARRGGGQQAEVLRQQARRLPPRGQLAQHAAAHRARHPRERRRRPGLRAVRRPAHRLGKTTMHVGRDAGPPDDHPHPQRPDPRGAPLHRPQPAPGEPDPRRPRPAAAPARADRHHLGGAQQARRARTATPPRCTPTLDELRDAYTDLYEEAEAISRSSVVAARIAGAQAAAADRRRRPPRGARADRIPHDVRAKIPPSRPPRRCARRSAASGRRDEHPDQLGPRPDQPRGTHRLRHRLALDPRRAGCGRGATAVLRVKDEAPSLPFVLPPLLRACDHVLVVDNGSDRRHPRGGRRAAAAGRAWPTGSARRRTRSRSPAPAPSTSPTERSVHSLAYFYNWCFAQVRTRYSWKWDGDMVLTTEGEVSIGDLRLAGRRRPTSIIRVPRHGLYLDDDRHGLPRPRPAQRRGVGLPDRPGLRVHQGLRVGDPDDARRVRSIGAAAGLVRGAEVPRRRRVRALDRPRVVRDAAIRNKRKRREWTVFNALQRRRGPDGVHRDRRARGRAHRRPRDPEWLPARPRPLPSTTPTTPSCSLRA